MVTEKVKEAIHLAFRASDEQDAMGWLSSYDGPECERIHLACSNWPKAT